MVYSSEYVVAVDRSESQAEFDANPKEPETLTHSLKKVRVIDSHTAYQRIVQFCPELWFRCICDARVHIRMATLRAAPYAREAS